MASPTPLKSSALVDCARANINQGIELAAERCGYENDIKLFEQELRSACHDMGIDVNSFADLIEIEKVPTESVGIEIAPDSAGQL